MFEKKASAVHRCPHRLRYSYVYTVAETIDYPDFYHWQANVAEDTIVAHEKILCVSVADILIHHVGQD